MSFNPTTLKEDPPALEDISAPAKHEPGIGPVSTSNHSPPLRVSAFPHTRDSCIRLYSLPNPLEAQPFCPSVLPAFGGFPQRKQLQTRRQASSAFNSKAILNTRLSEFLHSSKVGIPYDESSPPPMGHGRLRLSRPGPACPTGITAITQDHSV